MRGIDIDRICEEISGDMAVDRGWADRGPRSFGRAGFLRRKPIRPVRPCEFCAEKFTPRADTAGRFCSRECTYAARRGKTLAEFKRTTP